MARKELRVKDLVSKSGRKLSPAPPFKASVNFMAKMHDWLIQEAMIEANDYEKILLSQIVEKVGQKNKVKKQRLYNRFTSADIDVVNLVLFDELEVHLVWD